MLEQQDKHRTYSIILENAIFTRYNLLSELLVLYTKQVYKPRSNYKANVLTANTEKQEIKQKTKKNQ